MLRDLTRSVRSFLAEKHAVASRESRLIDQLNRLLPAIGYRVVPSRRASGHDGVGAAAKPLACPQCDRRFSRPLHLGRHLSATHRRRIA